VADRPVKTLADLRSFYTNEYRPLYDRFIIAGVVAQELHTEVACAADHLLFISSTPGGDISSADIERAAAHLKRATFDAFKLIFENDIGRRYNLLMDEKYADVHDGKFRSEITDLMEKAKGIATVARLHETMSRNGDIERWGAAFDEWKKILPLADEFTRLMTLPEVTRAVGITSAERRLAIFSAIFGAVVGALLSLLLGKLVN